MGLSQWTLENGFREVTQKKMTRLIKCYTGQEDVAGDDRKKEHDT